MNPSQSSRSDSAGPLNVADRQPNPEASPGQETAATREHPPSAASAAGGEPPSPAPSRPAPSRLSGAVVFWVALLLLFAGAMTLWGAWKLFQRTTDGEPGVAAVVGESPSDVDGQPNGAAAGGPGSDQPWIEEFTLTERSGKPFDSRDLAGKVWLASFFFATCPSYCVQQNQHIQALEDQFGDEGVVFVSITCDPKQDTPEKLREYARRFDADPEQWVFLTGDLNYIRRIGAEKFRQPVHEQTHKNNLVVVDKSGELRGSFDWNDEEEMAELRKLLPELLAEPPPQESESPAADGE